VNLRELPVEVLLAAAYAIFLLGVAAVLEKLAGHSRRRADQYEVAGFRYHAGFDHWECPEGNHLVRVETNHEQRTVKYRAAAHHCNACRCKPDCTDSDTGREIEHQLDLWLRTGLGQFHRGLSLALIVLAGLLVFVEAVRYREVHSMTLLGALFVAALWVAFRVCWRTGPVDAR
jgi:hypothetical protein